ncbi:hypothetical protein WA158_003647 [Blastocystis sp. Blastoise]
MSVNIKTDHSTLPVKTTTSPILTGGSVLGIKYNDGIMVAADTQGSYGSMAMHRRLQRIHTFSNGTMVAVSGEISDYQILVEEIEEELERERLEETNSIMSTVELYNYIRTLLYDRRNDFKPNWNDIIVAGIEEGVQQLFVIDQLGTCWGDDYLVTGFGASFALPLIRSNWRQDLTEGEARGLLEQALRLCYYGDCKAINRFQLGKVTANGAVISEPFTLETNWV